MRIGFTSVVGDLFHAGHIAMIQECRQHCDYLIVCVMADTRDREGKNVPVQSLFERCYQVAGCKGVDEIYACAGENDLLLALQVLSPPDRYSLCGRGLQGQELYGQGVLSGNRHRDILQQPGAQTIINGIKGKSKKWIKSLFGVLQVTRDQIGSIC